MKPASAALKALLASRAVVLADLYTFALAGGGTLRYTSFDRDILWNGTVFAAGGATGPYFDRQADKAKAHWKIGVEVDQLVFDVLPGSSTVLGEPFLSAVRSGVFDGAELTLERTYFAQPLTAPPLAVPPEIGTLVLFVGRVAEVEAGRSLARVTVNSPLELLNINLPRNLYQPGCANTLYDAGCGLSAAGFAVATAAAAGSTASVIAAPLTQPLPGYFTFGKVTFTAGALAGLSRSIGGSDFAPSPPSFRLMSPFPVAPAPGDACIFHPGCDKQQATCSGKFGNLRNFRGFPYVPVPETAV